MAAACQTRPASRSPLSPLWLLYSIIFWFYTTSGTRVYHCIDLFFLHSLMAVRAADCPWLWDSTVLSRISPRPNWTFAAGGSSYLCVSAFRFHLFFFFFPTPVDSLRGIWAHLTRRRFRLSRIVYLFFLCILLRDDLTADPFGRSTQAWTTTLPTVPNGTGTSICFDFTRQIRDWIAVNSAEFCIQRYVLFYHLFSFSASASLACFTCLIRPRISFFDSPFSGRVHSSNQQSSMQMFVWLFSYDCPFI